MRTDIQLPLMFHGRIKNRTSLTQCDVYLFSHAHYRAVQFDTVGAPRFHSHGAPCRTVTRYTQTWDESKRHATVIQA